MCRLQRKTVFAVAAKNILYQHFERGFKFAPDYDITRTATLVIFNQKLCSPSISVVKHLPTLQRGYIGVIKYPLDGGGCRFRAVNRCRRHIRLNRPRRRRLSRREVPCLIFALPIDIAP